MNEKKIINVISASGLRLLKEYGLVLPGHHFLASSFRLARRLASHDLMATTTIALTFRHISTGSNPMKWSLAKLMTSSLDSWIGPTISPRKALRP